MEMKSNPREVKLNESKEGFKKINWNATEKKKTKQTKRSRKTNHNTSLWPTNCERVQRTDRLATKKPKGIENGKTVAEMQFEQWTIRTQGTREKKSRK